MKMDWSQSGTLNPFLFVSQMLQYQMQRRTASWIIMHIITDDLCSPTIAPDSFTLLYKTPVFGDKSLHAKDKIFFVSTMLQEQMFV